MGAIFSKPRRSRHIADSIVLCDGLPPIKHNYLASTEDGRFIFVLGNRRVTSVDCGITDVFEAQRSHNRSDLATTFELDVIDLLSSRRTRLHSIGDLYGAGCPIGLYALNDHVLVLVELCPNTHALYQRMIRIDRTKGEITHDLYRRYAMRFNDVVYTASILVDKEAVLIKPCGGPNLRAGYIVPINPLSSINGKDIRHLFDEANAWLPAMYQPDSRILVGSPPLFFAENEVACFISTRSDQIYLNHIIVIDTRNGSIRVANLPPEVMQVPAYSRSQNLLLSNGGRQVALTTRCQLTELCWRTCLASIARRLADKAHALGQRSWMPTRMGWFCVFLAGLLYKARTRLTNPNKWPYVRFGILDTRSLEYTKVEAPNTEEIESFASSRSGDHFMLASVTKDTGHSRAIGSQATSLMKRYEIVRNPKTLASLTRLATVAVQRSGRVGQEELELIGARIV